MAPFDQAQYDLLWIIDSTISISPGALGRSVDAFLGTSVSGSSFDNDLESTPLLSDEMRKPPAAGDVGLVHHVPYAVVYQRTWGSLIEQAFLNTTHAKMYLAIVRLSPAFPYQLIAAERSRYRFLRDGEIEPVLAYEYRLTHHSVPDLTSTAKPSHRSYRLQPVPRRGQHDRLSSLARAESQARHDRRRCA